MSKKSKTPVPRVSQAALLHVSSDMLGEESDDAVDSEVGGQQNSGGVSALADDGLLSVSLPVPRPSAFTDLSKLTSSVGMFAGHSVSLKEHPVRSWLGKLEAIASKNSFDPKEALPYVTTPLVFNSLRVLRGVDGSPLLECSWAEVRTWLLQFYGGGNDEYQVRKELMALRQGNLSVGAYAESFLNTLGRLDTYNLDGDWTPHFHSTLSQYLQEKLQTLPRSSIDTFQKLLVEAIRFEAIAPPTGHSVAPVRGLDLASILPDSTVSAVNMSQSRKFQRSSGASKCGFCGKPGHSEDVCWSKHPEQKPKSFRRHPTSKQIAALFAGDQSLYGFPLSNRPGIGVVDRYADVDVAALDDPELQRLYALPRIEVRIGGVPISALLDSGACTSVCSAVLARRVRLRPSASPLKLNGAFRGTQMTLFASEASMVIGSFAFPVRIQVVENLAFELILGWDFFVQTGLLNCPRSFTATLLTPDRHAIQIPHLNPPKGASSGQVATVSSGSHELELPQADTSAVPEEFRAALSELLTEFSDVFATRPDQYGTANCEPLKLRVRKGIESVRMKFIEVSVAEARDLENQIDEWLANGRIKPSTSASAVNCFFVKRPDGGRRLVLNLAPINRYVVANNFPTPSTQLMFDSLVDKPFRSKFDFQAAYLQIRVNKDSTRHLSFVTPQGQYEFNYVPFGLNVAGAKLQLELNNMFRQYPNIVGYADDWVVADASGLDHLASLRNFLLRVRESGFLLKRSKCVFFARELHLLGRLVVGNTITADPASVADMLARAAPSNVSQLRSFLGSAEWLAKFVDAYALLKAPLNRLLRDSVRWSWGAAEQSAFEAIRTRLADPSILQLPDLSKPFVVETDASGVGLGAVLMQDGRPVAYASRALKPSEVAAPITLLELSAVLFALRRWHMYLDGAKFTLVTDHMALTWLNKQTNRPGPLGRWASELIGYDYVVVHRPGRRHHKADSLSRCIASILAIPEGLLPSNPDIAAAQRADPELSRLRTMVATGAPEAAKFVISPDDILCTLTHRYGLPVFRKLVPEPLRKRIIAAAHLDSAHSGVAEVISRIAESFSWRGLTADVRRQLKSCVKCLRLRAPPANVAVPTGTLDAEFPGDIVATDILAGLPVNTEGNMYILVVIDHFTRFATAIPMASKTSAAAAQAFETGWIQPFFPPARLLSDQGGEFSGAEFSAMLRANQVAKLSTTAYHPQGDSVAERFNRTLLEALGASLGADKRAWGKVLPSVITAYNSSVHSMTGHTPAFLMFSREPPSSLTRHDATTVSAPERLEAERAAAIQARADVRVITLKKRALVAARNEAMSSAPAKFAIGDLVMVRNPAIRQAPYSKLEPPFDGPCRIVKKSSATIFLTKLLPHGQPRSTHVRHMKPYYPPVGPHVSNSFPASTPASSPSPHATVTAPTSQLPTPLPQSALVDRSVATSQQVLIPQRVSLIPSPVASSAYSGASLAVGTEGVIVPLSAQVSSANPSHAVRRSSRIPIPSVKMRLSRAP